MNTNPTNIDTYIELGGNPAAAAHQNALEAIKKRVQERKDVWLQGAAKIAARGLAIVSVGFVLIAVLFGIAAATVLTFLAEISSVADGFGYIDPGRAGLMSLALVIGYIVVLFVRLIMLGNNPEPPKLQLSLRTVISNVWYFVGIGDNWQPRTVTKMATIDSLLRVALWTIVIAGLLGRLLAKMDVDLPWHVALINIFTTSNLSDFMGFVAMPLATITLLHYSKFFVWFVYVNFSKVTGGLDFLEDSGSELETEIQAYWAIQIQRLKAKQQPITANLPEQSENLSTT